MTLERDYQLGLFRRLRQMFPFPDFVVTKTDPDQYQGVPDIEINMFGRPTAHLEVKKSRKEHHQPNQDWYIQHINDAGGFASFIFPENEDEVLDKLKTFFEQE